MIPPRRRLPRHEIGHDARSRLAGGPRRPAGARSVMGGAAALALAAVGAALVGVLPAAAWGRTARELPRAVEHRAAPAPASRLPRMTIARLHYDGGGDWYANPSSLPNLLEALRQRTTLPVERDPVELRLTDDRLWDFPVLHATGHGDMRLSDQEVDRLREYLTRGGFLHVDDNYGLDPSFRREIARVFPDRPLVDVPLSHPIYHLVYDFPQGVPKIHEHDGKAPRGLGVFIGDRLAVFYSYESDLGNGWEDVGTYEDPPALHEAALRMGVNLFVYAVTSRPVS